jgi:hypothetical protein
VSVPTRRGRIFGASLAVGALALGAFTVHHGTSGSSSATANLFVDADGGTCTRQASHAAYNDAAACSTLQAAYTACSSGDTIGVRAGSYTSQSIARSTRTGPQPCTFQETNGDVTLASLSVLGDWATFDGFTSTGGVDMDDNDGSNRIYNVTFRNVISQSGLYLADTENTTWQGGQICCKSANSVKVINMAGQVNGNTATANSNLTIDGADIYDSIRLDNLDNHKECLFLIAVQTATIKNNHFWNCAIYSISIGRIGTDLDPSNVLIENNTMEPSDDQTVGGEEGNSTIVLDHVSTRFAGLIIRNNSMAEGIEINTADVPDSTGYDQTTIESNIIDGQGSCVPAGMTSPTYINNVLDGANCGTGATMVADANALFTTHTAGAGGSGYAGRTWDFHIASGSAARGAASTTSGQFSTTDIGGHARDGAPDAGAYEYGSGS